MSLETSTRRIAHHVEVLSRIGRMFDSPEKGFLRAGYSKEEADAIKHFENYAKQLGLSSRFDAIGNFTAETESKSGKFIEFASHLDTVPYGGNYDGVAGVVAGMEAIERLLESGEELSHGLRLRIWRLEEGATFKSACTGSQAALGKLNREVLDYSFKGQTLREAISSAGFEPSVIEQRNRSISQGELDSIVAHLELHIEQANLLEQKQ